MGEASNPGPASKRCRTQRSRALQRSMDSESEDDRPLVSTSGPKVLAMSDREDSAADTPGVLCQVVGVDQPTTLEGCWWRAIGVAPTLVRRHPAVHVRQIPCRRGDSPVSWATGSQITISFTRLFHSIGRRSRGSRCRGTPKPVGGV